MIIFTSSVNCKDGTMWEKCGEIMAYNSKYSGPMWETFCTKDDKKKE